MNVNSDIRRLKELTGLPVEPDLYEGASDKWITFSYQDEYPEEFADDEAQYETAELYVQLYTPHRFNYFALKKVISRYLEDLDGCVLRHIRSVIVSEEGRKYRQVTFDIQIKRKK